MCGGRRLFPTILLAIGALPEPAVHLFELSNSSFYVDAGEQNTQVFMLARQALYTLSISKTPESDGGFFWTDFKEFPENEWNSAPVHVSHSSHSAT